MCGICPSGCWIEADIDEAGRLAAVRPQAGHPLGMLCRRGAHSPEIVHSEHRLTHPLRRTGPQGSYEFERIGWDEAMGLIVEGLERVRDRYGPEAACVYTGRGSFESGLCEVFQPRGVRISSASSVLFPFGSPNTTGVGALCYVSFAMIAPHVTLGEMFADMYPDVAQAELIVVWGTNPATDSPPLDFERIKHARRMGAEVVVIDPTRTETAKATGARWVPIRPGTDGALALAMLGILIEEELYDEQFAEEWTVGFDELRRYVRRFPPAEAERITGVPAQTIRDLARRIAVARSAALVMYTGLEYSNSGVQAIRAAQILWALAGQLDVPGGLNFKMRANEFPVNRSGHVPNPAPEQAVGRDRFPLYSRYRGESHAIALPAAVLEDDPYPVRALLVVGGSILTAWPDPSLWRRTLGTLDLLVCIDRQLTADCAYADLVLPATTYYETTSYMTYGPIFRIRERLIEPVGEARSDFRILTDLAQRLGYGHLYPRDEEELLRHALEGSAFTVEEVRAAGGTVQARQVMAQYRKWEKGTLRADGRPGFNTPSGKLEIASSTLAEHGYDALPVYTEPREGPLSRPDLAPEYPLVFNSGARVQADFRSQHHGVRGLLAGNPDPFAAISPADAAHRRIEDGDWVEVRTPRGATRFRARVTEDIVPGTIDANMGGGGPVGPESWQRCNVNELTDLANHDPISGFPVYKALLCEVVKVAAGNGRSPAGDRRSDRSAGPDSSGAGVVVPATPERQVYLDNNATTPLHPEVLEAMLPFLRDDYGNPSSIHSVGYRARRAMDDGLKEIGALLGCTPRRLVLTGGGSEADNLAIKGAARARRAVGNHLVTSAIEHPAVLEACRRLERMGFEVTYVGVDAEGLVDPKEVLEAIGPRTTLVSVMHANNEVGSVQPIAEIAAIARERGVLFHTDAVQSAGKLALEVDRLGVDLLSLSAHKIDGPKGVGALYVRRGVELEALVDGGGQQQGLRGGTENVPGIVGFGAACRLAKQRQSDWERVRALRDRLQAGVERALPGAALNGPEHQRLPNTLSMRLPGIRGESLVYGMDRLGVALSSGSACKAGHPDPSHVLLAMGLSEEEAHGSVRFSLGHETTGEDVEAALTALTRLSDGVDWDIAFVPCK
ncbi:MAG: aminotransferase class V-fold PLP-dependent enzyme, partial [Solirubrobacterales bacterium]|nr:aminotransferase class V-fold PLP-dependent enzyme [Solirubrobacterales bacterium]